MSISQGGQALSDSGFTLTSLQDRARHAAQVRGRPDEMVSLLAQVEEVVGLVPERAEHVQLPFAEFFRPWFHLLIL